MKLKRSIILLTIVAIFIAAFYNKPVIRRYTLDTELGDSGSSITIVAIADLHNTSYGKDQKELIAKITKQEPDLIVLLGDIIDNANYILGAEKLLEKIGDLAPIYYVTGNHEYWTHKSDDIIKLIESYGVVVLSGDSVELVLNTIPITLCGMDDPDAIYYSDAEKYQSIDDVSELLYPFIDLDEKNYNILLAHRPELIEDYKDYNFDLVLSGHAHGGQVRIPLFLNGLFAPNQGWYPKYAGGLYEHENLTHIVSRGLSIQAKLPRIFNPPEIVVVELKSE